MCFIPAVRGGGVVRSFFAPYLCAECAHEASMLIEVEAHRATLAAQQAPPIACPSCGGAMTLADLPERFFAFLRA